METYDVIVIGGGPAGMMAAGRAAELGRRVLLLEQNRSLGKKLNLTGGGRCNITHAEFDTRALLAHFGESAKFLYSPFSQFTVQATFDFFDELGLPLKVEPRQRAFPETERASDVTQVLFRYMELHGARIKTDVRVVELLHEGGRMTGIKTSAGDFSCERLILASGGAAYRETGSTGAGFRWLSALGHTVHEADPDVVPLKVKETWVKALSGTSLEEMEIAFTSSGGECIRRRGRLLFTHFGLSGPLILNSAHAIKKLLAQGDVTAAINLFPALELEPLDRQLLAHFEAHKNKVLRNALRSFVPAGMCKPVLGLLSHAWAEKPVHQITQAERRRVVELMRGLPLTVTGTMGYDWAVICDGGVELAEVDTRTMASRLYPNLYLVGDLLNISRPSGGFSLQLCWTTGYVAGSAT